MYQSQKMLILQEKKKKNKYNYDVEWFGNILSSVENLRLNNSWPCLWSKMPLQWLLKFNADSADGLILEDILTLDRAVIDDNYEHVAQQVTIRTKTEFDNDKYLRNSSSILAQMDQLRQKWKR